MKTLQIAQSGSLHPICSPARITLSRRKGWRMPPNTVKVCRPGKWGNPFHVADVLDHYDGDEDKAAADCTRSYRRWVEEGTNYCITQLPRNVRAMKAKPERNAEQGGSDRKTSASARKFVLYEGRRYTLTKGRGGVWRCRSRSKSHPFDSGLGTTDYTAARQIAVQMLEGQKERIVKRSDRVAKLNH